MFWHNPYLATMANSFVHKALTSEKDSKEIATMYIKRLPREISTL